ncbi:hypothetical protein HOLleu_21133 [Holothuria leucospilota]|uniref:Uncharacterized protein n=1 Tax=Holothuria leucospilota TaxID=206669 RepID=A0A9Q1BX90_HOLLE|nr:hypothetical protein HOLleu_21133 [Holothuria leucospilota]
MLPLAVFTIVLALAQAYTDPECSSYDHENYGCSGECISTSSCPGGKYISNLCPTQAAGIKCCFTADSDDECVTYDHSTYGKVGHCISTGSCPYSNYISNLCPTKAAGIKCCFSKPEGTCGSSGGTDRVSLACDILNHPRVTLLSDNGALNPSGSGDGASALDNIRDTCNGGRAKRSSYCCSSGCTPGGSVYLSTSVLSYIRDLLDDGYNLQVNCLAGACHSTNSWHYQGTAVDFQVFSGSPYSTWMSRCSAAGARENLGPGDAGHSTHTHCAFSS